MSQFPRVVIGYHGCVEPFATRLLSGETLPEEWRASENVWDWLGNGIYFWEGALERAFRWAEEKAQKTGGKPAVIGAILDLSHCFDLTDERFTRLLRPSYEQLAHHYEINGLAFPENRGGRRERDCLIINDTLSRMPEGMFSCVRAPFWEGPEVYSGAMIRQSSHIQIVVRDRSCILGIFRPNLFR